VLNGRREGSGRAELLTLFGKKMQHKKTIKIKMKENKRKNYTKKNKNKKFKKKI